MRPRAMVASGRRTPAPVDPRVKRLHGRRSAPIRVTVSCALRPASGAPLRAGMTLERDRMAAALPQYEIEGELGRGGFGVVLQGRHRHLGREVAIKQLPRAFAADPAVRGRFVAEAKVLATIDHPHVVPVYDYVEDDGLCLLVMEKLAGGTVWTRFTTTGMTM